MPIVVNELVFKGEITEPKPTSSDTEVSTAGSRRLSATDRRLLIEACVEEVLKILHERGER